MNGFDDFDTKVTAEEFFEDEADYYDSWRDEVTVAPEPEQAYQSSGDAAYDALFEDFLSQFDDDPSPYGGTYSEE